MGLYEHWPYTNFHELNLDWLVEEIRKWAADYKQIHDETEGMLAQIAELKRYVDSYFDDLDIQTEINNKIDEMVADGTFERIVGDYIDVIEQDMADKSYYNEITWKQFRSSNTNVYVVTVPRIDSDGKVIQISIEKDLDNSPAVHAQKTYSTLTTNGQLYMKSENDNWLTGNIVSKGVALNNQTVTENMICSGLGYVTISEDRTIVKEYPITTPMLTLLGDPDVYTCFNFYAKIVDNSTAVDVTSILTNERKSLELADANFAFGVKSNGDLVFLGCDARTFVDRGLQASEVSALLIAEGCTKAWMLDGGGSTSINYKGSKLNKSLDDNWSTDRMIPWTINFRKEDIAKSIAESFSNTGAEKFQTNENIMPMFRNLFDRIKTIGGVDLDDEKTTGAKYIINAVNSPSAHDDGTLIVIGREGPGVDFNNPEDVQQFWIAAEQPQFVYSRHYENDAWGVWSMLYGVERNKKYAVQSCDVVGVIDGNKIYFTIPISPVTDTIANASFQWANGGVIIYYDGYELAGSSTPKQFTMGYCRLIENVGAVCRMDCGSDLTNDAHYKNKAVCMLEFSNVFIQV